MSVYKRGMRVKEKRRDVGSMTQSSRVGDSGSFLFPGGLRARRYAFREALLSKLTRFN